MYLKTGDGHAHLLFSDAKSSPFEEPFVMMIHTLECLITLHGFGVIHDDVHYGHVVLMDDTLHRIGFIDFRMAAAFVHDLETREVL